MCNPAATWHCKEKLALLHGKETTPPLNLVVTLDLRLFRKEFWCFRNFLIFGADGSQARSNPGQNFD
jgi:hypothetical protein